MAVKASILNDGNVVGDATTEDAFASLGAAGTPSAVLHRSLHHEPLRVVAARGNHLELNNGQRIFDATGGAAVSCLGHGNER